MDTVRIGINGLGRIGRSVLRLSMSRPGVTVAGVNDLAAAGDLAYLIAHDSVHGPYPGSVAVDDDRLSVDGEEIPILSVDSPARLPWSDLGVDVVIEATGVFRHREDAAGHLAAGARKVIISAPSDDADLTLVLGVNDQAYEPERHHVVSNASCTTNCVAPMLKVLHDAFEIEWGMFTTVHAYTASQSLVDRPMRKRRRGRAGALSLVPTTTGAAHAAEVVLPELAGRLDGLAVRAPVPNGSLTDLVARLSATVTRDEVLEAYRRASSGELDGILAVADEELVSVDIIGDPRSALIDAPSLRVLNGNAVKVLAWYDNELGYSARLVDLAEMMGR